jgi:hypothetical protein
LVTTACIGVGGTPQQGGGVVSETHCCAGDVGQCHTTNTTPFSSSMHCLNRSWMRSDTTHTHLTSDKKCGLRLTGADRQKWEVGSAHLTVVLILTHRGSSVPCLEGGRQTMGSKVRTCVALSATISRAAVCLSCNNTPHASCHQNCLLPR